MHSLFGILWLLLALLLQLLPAQMSQLPREDPFKGRASLEVVEFQDVVERSMCRPMEQLVDVEREFPEDVEYIYVPACVPLWRCSGCCGDENLECLPTLQRNISLQVMRLLPLRSKHRVELLFVEHQKCECRQKLQNNKSSKPSKNRPRRRKHKRTAHACGKCQFPPSKISLH